MKLYVTGINYGSTWDLVGIFDKEYDAINNCPNENYWIAPVTLNEPIFDIASSWEGLYFPKENLKNNTNIHIDYKKKER